MTAINQLPGTVQAVSNADVLVLSQVASTGPNAGAAFTVQAPIGAVAAAVSAQAAAAQATATSAAGVAAAALPLAGGTMTGDILPLSINGALFAANFASIQAAHDALPSTGGSIVLPPNTTYSISTMISFTKDNVRLIAPSWGTVLKRAVGLGGTNSVLRSTGANCRFENFTVDGNGANQTGTGADLDVRGAHSIVFRCQIINGGTNIHLALQGADCRACYNTITGLGTDLGTGNGYGIWAVNHVKVTIDHNTVSGTGVDGIGFDGPGSQVTDNYLFNCHTYPGVTGGHIVKYADTGGGAIIADNYVGAGNGTLSAGLEVNGNNVTISGNIIAYQKAAAIGLSSGAGFTVTGNTVINPSTANAVTYDGIVVNAGVTDFVIEGNHIYDNQGTPTIRYSINVNNGASDRYSITGNVLVPSNAGSAFLADGGTGIHKTIANNVGVDDRPATLASAASLTLPVNPVIYLTGSVGVTSIAAGAGFWAGRAGKFIPNGAVVFTAGATIGNTVTTTANVPLGFTCDGIKLYLG